MNNIEKFPIVLKERIRRGEFSFPEETLFEYEGIAAFRAVRKIGNGLNRVINREDFRSFAELGVHRPGLKEDIPQYYGTSLFKDIDELRLKMKFPRPALQISKGIVFMEGGPCLPDKQSTHICWWLFEDVLVSEFKLVEEDKL